MRFKNTFILFLILFVLFSLFSCKINSPNLDINNEEKKINQLIEEEYTQLLNNKKDRE